MQIKKSRRFYYSYKEGIETRPLLTKKDLFSLLHELGHAACGHTPHAEGKIDLSDVVRECEAWRYALRCVQAEQAGELINFALPCIATYNTEAEITWGEWLSKKEIINILKKEAGK